ncbi:hypothetical protein VNO80_10098 [Phaseolus coccineus]|uniref:Uncharacterized protein n=1 Tax=Phaseolus coccineus TaxID=3886 RepID=A0AAN9RD59_PHACN
MSLSRKECKRCIRELKAYVGVTSSAELENADVKLSVVLSGIRLESEEDEKTMFDLNGRRRDQREKALQADWSKVEENLKNEISLSFSSNFDVAIKQVICLHLDMDLSQLDPRKVVVDRKLVEDA